MLLQIDLKRKNVQYTLNTKIDLMITYIRQRQAKFFYSLLQYFKGVFAKNERGYRLNAIKKRF